MYKKEIEMLHAYNSTSDHFQRQEKRNVGITQIAMTKWFRLGFKDYMEQNEMREFGHFFDKEIMVQSAYELGRLFGAYCKGSNVTIKKWYFSTGKKGWKVHYNLIDAVRVARKLGVFC